MLLVPERDRRRPIRLAMLDQPGCEATGDRRATGAADDQVGARAIQPAADVVGKPAALSLGEQPEERLLGHVGGQLRISRRSQRKAVDRRRMLVVGHRHKGGEPRRGVDAPGNPDGLGRRVHVAHDRSTRDTTTCYAGSSSASPDEAGCGRAGTGRRAGTSARRPLTRCNTYPRHAFLLATPLEPRRSAAVTRTDLGSELHGCSDSPTADPVPRTCGMRWRHAVGRPDQSSGDRVGLAGPHPHADGDRDAPATDPEADADAEADAEARSRAAEANGCEVRHESRREEPGSVRRHHPNRDVAIAAERGCRDQGLRGDRVHRTTRKPCTGHGRAVPGRLAPRCRRRSGRCWARHPPRTAR